MPFPRRLLNVHEDVVLDLRPHWWYLSKATAGLVGAFVFVIIVQVGMSSGTPKDVLSIVSLVVLLAALVMWVRRYLMWSATNFVVTTDRLIFRQGVLAKSGIEIPLDRVNNVNFKQTIFERILGAGDLLIESGSEAGQQRFSDIRKPELVQKEIHAQVEANEIRRIDRTRGGAARASDFPPPPAPASSVVDQIAQLDALRARGVLTQEEFDAKKRQLLDRL